MTTAVHHVLHPHKAIFQVGQAQHVLEDRVIAGLRLSVPLIMIVPLVGQNVLMEETAFWLILVFALKRVQVAPAVNTVAPMVLACKDSMIVPLK